MRKSTLILLSFSLFLFLGCSTVKKSIKTEKDLDNSKKYNNSENVDLSLANQLRKIPGVSVQGDGIGAIIFIRGKSSFNSSSEPLFLLNNQIVDGGFASVVNLIDPREIKYIEVLKNASEISSFGVRGTNGIIKITTK